MPLPPPDLSELQRLNDHYSFGLSESDLEEFAPLVVGSLSASDRVVELYEAAKPPAPTRAWSHPEDNPLGAWAVQTRIEGRSDGPMAGKTVVIKDNMSVAGLPMMNGSRSMEGFVPARDATVVTRLLQAGATVVGKAVCEDLSFSGASFTSQPGPVRNPWDITRIAGGSSSGSAALVASQAVDLAVGGDQGGSIRIPASFCGCVGLKPTYGLVPYTGAFPIERTLDHVGPIGRTVSDVALMLTAIAGVDGLDPRQPTELNDIDYTANLDRGVTGLRVGIVRQGFGGPLNAPAVDEAVLAAVAVLRRSGLVAEEVTIPWHTDALDVWNVIATEGACYQMIDGNAYGQNAAGLYDPEVIEWFARGRRERGPELSRIVKLVGLSGGYTFGEGGGKYYAMARNLAMDVTRAYDEALTSFDVLVMPTLPYTATEILTAAAPLAEYVPAALSMVSNCAPFDVSGHPAISVPVEPVDGLPVGLMIVGRRFDDATVLQVAHTYENAVGGFANPPALEVGSKA
jgi:amidase